MKKRYRTWTAAASVAVLAALTVAVATSEADATTPDAARPGATPAVTAIPAHFAAPYLQIGSESTGDMAADTAATGLKFYTLAFLIPKSGCTPEWEDGGDSLGAFTSQVNAVKSAGGNVIISFGGEAGGELAQTCTSVSSLTAAYQNVVNTYGITRLDFDIEGSPLDDTTSNSRRDQALAALQAANPAVQVDFTLPVDPTGLESNALALLNDAKSKGVNVSVVNIMTMDFGDGENVLADAESAANATHTQLTNIYGGTSASVWAKIGLTPIAGQNDDNENFTQSNATSLETFAAGKGVGELAFWEVHGYDKPAGWAYSRTFNKITSSGGSGGGTTTAYVGGGSGKCIDDNAGSTTNGTQLEIFTCNGGTNQQITSTGTTGTLTVLGKCFDAKGNATADNTIVEIWSCNGGDNQQWTINSTNHTIVGVQSSKCITVQSASTANLAKLILYTCNGKTNQVWNPQASAAAVPAATPDVTPAHPFPTHVTYKVGVTPSASRSTRDAAVEKQYNSWKATYLVHGCASNEYYVSTKGDDDAPHNGTVSEAQGYGMNIVPLMAGYDANAKTEFNGLWQLVKDHEDSHGMMKWQLDGKTCAYTDSGTPDGATDGDLDIGYGLILADKQWGGYRTDALNWLSHFWSADVASDGHLKCEDDGPSTDTRPSDMMLDHLRAFAAYDTSHDWNKVVTRVQAVISEFTATYSSSHGLLSDFVVNANTTSPKPAPANYQENQPDNIVGYNSIRVPWHLGTDALVYGTSTASVSYHTAVKESACLKSESGGKPQNVYPHTNLNCTPRTTDGDGNPDTQAEEAGDAVGPAAMAAGDQAWTDAIWNELAKNPFGDAYYGETIKMIVYIVMAGDYWNPVA